MSSLSMSLEMMEWRQDDDLMGVDASVGQLD